MFKVKRKKTSPGEILREEFLKHLGITQKALAKRIRCSYKLINFIVNEKANVTPELAIQFASVFGTTPEFWLNAQRAVD